MNAKKRDEYDIPASQIADLNAVRLVDDSRFTQAMDEVVKESEAMRLRYMQRHRSRSFLTMSLGMVLALSGAAAFGWFFLVKFDLPKGLLCRILALLVRFSFLA